MTEPRDRNRWWVVVGALVIQVSLGAVYIWSVFQTPLQRAFPRWTETEVTLPAQVVLGAFAIAVIFGGRLQDRLGPRKVATAGGVLLGLGLVLARFTGSFAEGSALVWLIATFSVLGGVGIGAAYVCPIATCVKWFPDKKGVITGLAVAGFGAGAFFFAPLAKGLISGVEYELLGLKLFSLPELEVFDTFLVLGIVFLVTVVAGAQLLRDPPDGYVPSGYAPPDPISGSTGSEHFTPAEMLRTPTFWLLWLTYFAGCTAGLQVIMKASPIWQSYSFGAATLPIGQMEFHRVTSAGATAVSVLAIFNSLGRIFWGKVSDSIGRKRTLVSIFVVCGPTMLALDSLRSFPQYLAGISLVGLCFGGYLALYPALTADFYGTEHLGANYGWMFTAYGAGGLFGPFLAAWLMKVEATVAYEVMEPGGKLVHRQFAVGNYRQAFVLAGVACLGAATACLLLRAPQTIRFTAPDVKESSVG